MKSKDPFTSAKDAGNFIADRELMLLVKELKTNFHQFLDQKNTKKQWGKIYKSNYVLKK